MTLSAAFPGRAVQACHLVPSLQEALTYWTGTMGAGPFFVLPPREFVELYYDGEPASDMRLIDAVALGQLGPVQIELIVPADVPSTYTRFLNAGGHGLHHYGYLTDSFDAMRAEAIRRGLSPVTEGRSQTTRFCYLQRSAQPTAPAVELIEGNDILMRTFAMVAEAHQEVERSPVIRYL